MELNLSRLGWRGRAGLILPSSNTVTEPVFYALAPQGVSFHTTRTFIAGTSLQEVQAMEKDKERAVRELASAKVDCIADCCTASGVVRGLEADKAFCESVEKETGIRTTSTLQAIVEALRALKLSKLVATSPYPPEMDELEKDFFEKNGFSVINIKGLDIKEGWKLGRVPPEDIYRLCRDAWDKRADGLFISCMTFNSIPVIQALELALQVPVVTSNTATLWKILRMLGITEPIWGYGRLLSDYMK
ncbi:MAG: maleate cis-trans isomerase [Dehalococcoidia bacterium]|nr:maleate cis-trans isomerase [Dehalococcoidia bacterium]